MTSTNTLPRPVDQFDSQIHEFHLVLDSQKYPVEDLTEYTFRTLAPTLIASYETDDTPQTFDAEVVGGDQMFVVQFRIRGVDGDWVRCGFFDLPIKQRESMIAMRDQLMSGASDELHSLSYDELAGGNTTKKENQSAKKVVTTPRRASTLKKTIALSLMVLAMVAIVGWILIVIQTRSTISVSNSVLVGNYQPINTPNQGKLLDVLVDVGDRVDAGQVVAVIGNEEVHLELHRLNAQLARSRSELVAYQRQAQRISGLMEFAKQKADRDLVVARAVLNGGKAELNAAQAQVNRLQPLVARGNIGVFEVDEAKALAARASAGIVRQNAVIETLNLAKTAAEKSVLVSVTGVSDPLAEVLTKIDLAQAAIEEAIAIRDSLAVQSQPVELVSPQSGTVYAVYRRQGEYLKIADEAIAISLDQTGWATGHIDPGLATQVRPGQPVEIDIPSMGITTSGKVAGIGHRSVYGRGRYNAEFRGGPLEVPIRVELDASDDRIPSGLRLNMTVRVHDHVAAMKNWFRSFGSGENATTSTSTSQIDAM